MRTAVSVFAVLILFAGCGSPRRSEPLTGKPTKASPDVLHGEEVYQRYCYQCHPGGEGGLGPSLNDKPAPVWLMRTQVRLGLGSMPSFHDSKIDDHDMKDLMEYITSMRKAK